MSILLAPRLAPKSSKIIFAPAMVRTLQNPTFGQGIIPQRDRKLPVGPNASDLQWAARELNTTADASDDEWADEFERRTMSVTDYENARVDALVAEHDRYADCDEAELSELRTSVPADESSFADELASAVFADRPRCCVCGEEVSRPSYLDADGVCLDCRMPWLMERALAPVKSSKPRPVTLHQMSRAKRGRTQQRYQNRHRVVATRRPGPRAGGICHTTGISTFT